MSIHKQQLINATVTDLQYCFPSLSRAEANTLLTLPPSLLDKLMKRVEELDIAIDGLHEHIATMEQDL